MKTIIVLFIVTVSVFSIDRLSRKEKKAFVDSYEMIKHGYENRKYQEVDYFGKKTIEEYKVIPIDNRSDVVKELLPKYLDIFYLIAKANLHLSLKETVDSLVICKSTFDYECMEKLADNIISTIKRSGITKKDDTEKSYFLKFLRDAESIKDSIPSYARNEFNAAQGEEKKRIGEKVRKFIPEVLNEIDSTERKALDVRYYELLNKDDIEGISNFINDNSQYDPERLSNLIQHRESMIADAYLFAKKTKRKEDAEEYLKKYPGSKYDADMQNWLEWLYMRDALSKLTIYESRQYIEKYPQGRYAKEVMTHFDRLTRNEIYPVEIPKYERQ